MNFEIAIFALLLPAAIGFGLKESNPRRLLLIAVILVFTFRYVAWRIERFPFDNFYSSVSGWWLFCVLIVEGLALLEYAHFLVTVAWLTDRRPEADRREHKLRQCFRAGGTKALPSVDILIPTYNEPEEVVGKTILAATRIDYPRTRVYVLDDGQRPWLKTFCAEAGVEYVTRPDRSGAKAGNINHALGVIQGDLHLLLDADFIPFRNCLWRMVGFFEDSRLATLQTPQNFYNPDAIQHNLNISRSWGCEQEFFFQQIMRGRDAVGGAFCCGSCCLHRNAALRDVNGFPTSSITEDILLTVELLRRGWRTVYLCEATSMGLAAESMKAFFIQRKRWGRGNLQVGMQILKRSGLLLRHKFLLYPFYWSFQHGSRVFFQLIPIVFFLTGFGPLPASESQEIFDFQLPFIIAVMSSMVLLMRPYYMPLLTEAMTLFSSFALLPELLQSLVRPYGRSFQVTPKGSQPVGDGMEIYHPTFWPAVLFLIANITVLFKILLNLSDASNMVGMELAAYATIWCCLNISLLIVCVLMSLERSQPRLEHRMQINQTVQATTSKDHSVEVRLLNLSMTGARLQTPPNTPPLVKLKLTSELTLPISTTWSDSEGTLICKHAELNLDQKRLLIVYLFTGQFQSAEQPEQVQLRATLRRVWHACLG